MAKKLTFEEQKVRVNNKNNKVFLLWLGKNNHDKNTLFWDVDYGIFQRSMHDYMDKNIKNVGHPNRARANIGTSTKQRFKDNPETLNKLVLKLQNYYSDPVNKQALKERAKIYTSTIEFKEKCSRGVSASMTPQRRQEIGRRASKQAKEKSKFPLFRQFCIQNDVHDTTMFKYAKRFSKQPEETDMAWYNRLLNLYLTQSSSIELKIKELLDEYDIVYIHNKQFPNASIRPDFRIESHKLIIEADGVYYHTDRFKKRSYHKDRIDLYEKHGYKTLAFTDDDINHNWHIVRSMILNKLGKSLIIGARKCKIITLSAKAAAQFFNDNHLKGSGSGASLALEYMGDVVCAIRYKKHLTGVEIDRFANKINVSVTGGYSKLLSAINHSHIITFVDRRHGDGKSLLNMGFMYIKTHIGFSWVKVVSNNLTIKNRRAYLGNSGYKHGYHKLYDYGQLKFELLR